MPRSSLTTTAIASVSSEIPIAARCRVPYSREMYGSTESESSRYPRGGGSEGSGDYDQGEYEHDDSEQEWEGETHDAEVLEEDDDAAETES